MAFFFIEDNVHVYESGRVSGLSGKIGMSESFSLLKPELSEALALSVTDKVVT